MKKFVVVVVLLAGLVFTNVASAGGDYNSIYLWGDAPVFEKYTLVMSKQDQSAEFVAKNLGYFIDDLEDEVNKPKYFKKLKEVQQALLNNSDQVEKLINEAQNIRESQ